MFALIKREILDNLLFILFSVVLSAAFVLIAVWSAYDAEESNLIDIILLEFAIPAICIGALGLCGMGSSQMYLDKNKKLSAFICTHATTRSQILIARIITGLIAVAILLVPIAVTVKVLVQLVGPAAPVYASLVRDCLVTAFFTAFSCYCLGLQKGWSSSKIFPTFGAIGLTIILLTLVIIKGFGLHIWFILSLFIIASLVRTWNKFMTAAFI